MRSLSCGAVAALYCCTSTMVSSLTAAEAQDAALALFVNTASSGGGSSPK